MFEDSAISLKVFPESIVIPKDKEEVVTKTLNKDRIKRNIAFGFKTISKKTDPEIAAEDKSTVTLYFMQE